MTISPMESAFVDPDAALAPASAPLIAAPEMQMDIPRECSTHIDETVMRATASPELDALSLADLYKTASDNRYPISYEPEYLEAYEAARAAAKARLAELGNTSNLAPGTLYLRRLVHERRMAAEVRKNTLGIVTSRWVLERQALLEAL